MVKRMKCNLTNEIERWIKDNPEQRVALSEMSGTCMIEYDRRFFVSLEESVSGDKFFIFSVIGELAIETLNEVAGDILISNLFGRETGRSSIGYDDTTQSLILFRVVPYDNLTPHSFSEALNEFLAYRIYWDNKLSDLISKKNNSTPISSQNLNVYFG